MPKSPTRPTQYPSPQWARALHRGKPRHSCRGGRPKGLPAKTLAKRGDGVCLASDVGYLVSDFLDHALLTAARAPPSSHVLRGLLDLFFPSHTEQPLHPMFFEHEGNGFQERCFVGDLSFPTPQLVGGHAWGNAPPSLVRSRPCRGPAHNRSSHTHSPRPQAPRALGHWCAISVLT